MDSNLDRNLSLLLGCEFDQYCASAITSLEINLDLSYSTVTVNIISSM